MAPHFRALKAELRKSLQAAPEAWAVCRARLAERPAKELIGPLLACLLTGDEAARRAAEELGKAVARLADGEPGVPGSMEDARNVLRRLMWHMNEESGNIGWGVPEAFAEILVRQPRLADEFHSILLSYIHDTGRDDNYCDHALLRRSCFLAVGRLAEARPDLAVKAIPALKAGLRDEDAVCRAHAARVLGMLEEGPVRR